MTTDTSDPLVRALGDAEDLAGPCGRCAHEIATRLRRLARGRRVVELLADVLVDLDRRLAEVESVAHELGRTTAARPIEPAEAAP